MKNTRKLIPALAMLLVSAVMMSTASFAWFSTNSTATATGMKVQVAAAQTILIKEVGSAGAFATSVTLTDAQKTSVSPVSADAVTTPKFWKLDSAGNNMSPDSYEAGADSSFIEDATGENYIKKSILLRATGDPLDDVKVSITVSDNSTSPIDSCLRVMLVTGSTVLYYAPMAGAAPQKPVINYAEGAVQYADAVPDLANAESEFILEDITANTEYQIDIYVWYEGQDETCKANNAINIGDLNPTIAFTLASKP